MNSLNTYCKFKYFVNVIKFVLKSIQVRQISSKFTIFHQILFNDSKLYIYIGGQDEACALGVDEAPGAVDRRAWREFQAYRAFVK